MHCNTLVYVIQLRAKIKIKLVSCVIISNVLFPPQFRSSYMSMSTHFHVRISNNNIVLNPCLGHGLTISVSLLLSLYLCLSHLPLLLFLRSWSSQSCLFPSSISAFSSVYFLGSNYLLVNCLQFTKLFNWFPCVHWGNLFHKFVFCVLPYFLADQLLKGGLVDGVSLITPQGKSIFSKGCLTNVNEVTCLSTLILTARKFW